MTQEIRISTDAPEGLSPLLHFKGELKEWHKDSREFTNDDGSKRTGITIRFEFINIEVLDATEPYPYPIATIRVPYAPPQTSGGGTRWEALAKSLRIMLPDVPGDQRIDTLVGKSQEWRQLKSPLRVPLKEEDGVTPKVNERGRPVWGDGEGLAWQLVQLDGAGAPEDLTGFIAQVADGKTEQQFYAALLSDPGISPKIINRPDIVTSITDRKLLDSLLMANLVTRDPEGILHQA